MKNIKYFFLIFVIACGSTDLLQAFEYSSSDNSYSTPEEDIVVIGNDYGLSDFHMCVAYNQVQETMWFLNNGWSVNNNDNPYRITPLMLATAYDAMACAQVLVTSGANPYQDNGTISAYGIAVRDNRNDFLSLFEEQLDYFKTTYHTLLQGLHRCKGIGQDPAEPKSLSEEQNNTNVFINLSPTQTSVLDSPSHEKSVSSKLKSKKSVTKKELKKAVVLHRNKKGRFKKRASERQRNPRTFFGD
ncbi:hypothetical protein Noda2021_10560 [Candidatus Dependentiae bacterium Noda2021]|nr:hypothetical protein Noda2021_10560 [Candidatus Dependentiae bacterium Noda2021]